MPGSLSEEPSVETKCPTHDAPTRSLSEERGDESRYLFHVKRAVPLPRSVIERERRDESNCLLLQRIPRRSMRAKCAAARHDVPGRQPTVRSLSKEHSDETKCSNPRRPTGH